MTSCRIQCLRCGREFDSPLQFDDADSFFNSSLVGRQAQCAQCGLMTRCEKSNMIFVGQEAKEEEDRDDWRDYVDETL